MSYIIKLYHHHENKWIIWKNAYGNEIVDNNKERLEKQFKDTFSYKQFKLKYKIIELK